MQFHETGYFTDSFMDSKTVVCYNEERNREREKWRKNVTFVDIAAYNGFSKTTISRYFKAIPLRNWGRVLEELEIMYLNRLTVEET